ncbi:Elongation factor 4 [Porphyridium purpureum]|uniref:Translation factor GUF1 homolog, mitochondrial n=1 Tax=Porphyridium purpureum TaxID=35688 RepID=A0A5J4Z5E0_PORPP|nr:Elongation factor 4 [Porphyridium purpureum]|eukprot:POR5627..scf295_1
MVLSEKNAKAAADTAEPHIDDATRHLVKVPPERIRNFSIIAHIDHGKSTLADRLLQATGTVASRDMKQQFLDNMDIERERGITIKLQAARMLYRAKDGLDYILNLIDTPGHVDFSYEVSRSLMACEGALLVVDASQGIEAQTLANVYLALENNLEIIPVFNKIDLPGAEPERVMREVEEVIGLDCSGGILASAKAGIGIDEILESIVATVPPPSADAHKKPLRALIFDSYYDPYKGVVVLFRVMEGELRPGDKVRFMNSEAEFDTDEVGVLMPKHKPVDVLSAGEVGYLFASIKSVEDARVGDTITLAKRRAEKPLPGYQKAKPMVFAGLFPVSADDFNDLKVALEKFKLNDAALSFEAESSSAMGFGFRCGFLGMLHMDVVQERLEREYNLELITTAPSVVYRVTPTKGEPYMLDNPSQLPDPTLRKCIEEPYVKLDIITPEEYVGPLMELAVSRRGEFKDMRYLVQGRTTLVYEMPLAEMVGNFFDALKSRSKGYASMEYDWIGYRESDLVRLDINVAGDPLDALTCIVHRDKAYSVGKEYVKKLKEIIPRANFQIVIQAVIGTKSIASERISALRKDVTAKCYGGDISRKKKLLKKQAEGKKRMKAVGKVEVPSSAFLAIVNINGDS